MSSSPKPGKDGLPNGFRTAFGGFLFSCVELGTNVFFKMAGGKVSISNSLKNRGETGIFAEGDEKIKGTGQEN